MIPREMYSSYSLLQRISKRKQISKTGGFACKKEPEYCGSQCSGLFVRQSLKKPPAMQVDNNRFSLQ